MRHRTRFHVVHVLCTHERHRTAIRSGYSAMSKAMFAILAVIILLVIGYQVGELLGIITLMVMGYE
jgi:hypothetical protein